MARYLVIVPVTAFTPDELKNVLNEKHFEDARRYEMSEEELNEWFTQFMGHRTSSTEFYVRRLDA